MAVSELLFLVIVLLFAVIPFALLVYALIDLVKRPAHQWEAAQQSQVVWVLIVLLIGCIGPVIYLMVAKPKLDAVG